MQLKLFKKQYAAIPIRVLVFMAWRNIITRKLRSFLTLLGVVIGIGAIFFLLSLGLGLRNLVTEQIIGNESIKSIDVTSPNSRILQLNKESSEKIRGLENVSELGNSYSFAGALKYSGSEVDTIVYGVDDAYQKLSNLTVIEGRMIQSEDINTVFLNRAALETIGVKNPKDVLNKKLLLTVPLTQVDSKAAAIEEEFTIVGVIDSGAGSEVFVSGNFFEKNEVEQYSQIKLLSNDSNNIPELRRQIESLGFETTSPIDTIDQINQIFKYFNIILVGFGAIGMIVAVLGMFNTLTISLLERTREIGLMVALGGRHRDMRRLFVIEAILLSVIGSVIGIIMATILGQIVNLAMSRLADSRGVQEGFDLFATPIWLTVLLIGFMVLVGLVVVFFPARRAEKINPIDALRRE